MKILIDTTYLDGEDKNALHVSAILGCAQSVQAILSHEQFMQPGRGNRSFLHEMCLARDQNGRNFLHLAVIHGRLSILEMIRGNAWLMQVALEKADRRETILHLCVKYNQLGALQSLLQIPNDPEFLSFKNEGRQGIIIHLIRHAKGIISIKNANGKTALDLFLAQAKLPPRNFFPYKSNRMQFLRTIADGEIRDALINSDAMSGEDVSDFTLNEYLRKRVEKSKDAIMIVASVIATMVFQAMINPPGGVWQDDLLEVAFISSLTTILTLVMGQTKEPGVILSLLLLVIVVPVTAIPSAYNYSVQAMVPESARHLSDTGGSEPPFDPFRLLYLSKHSSFMVTTGDNDGLSEGLFPSGPLNLIDPLNFTCS
ncbi:OLC1v1008781C1 [Oldenlandia corymbosa var. corymbosa]|uniref:OLC1v1008781C1 n=1 Tax=Oldenlandia corymbosa var. corymbosa TaxID=529605 RepID=A0AAV1DMR6_OLDCO|nr:OLC1v1008781C1 [Oldenlandia corymbosa var. corymbosa]